MKATDLMIGDWVIRKGHSKEQMYIISIDDVCDTVQLDLDGIAIRDKIFNIEPIPLTSEILEKNGFEGKQFYGELLCGGWQIMCDCKRLAARSEDGWLINITCENVHELQHALRLCGIDKEIKL